MLGYLVNLSLPVLIYFISYLSVVFIQTFYKKDKKKIFKYLILLVLVTIFLEYLYRKKYITFVWMIVLSPLLLLFLIIMVFMYLFIFFKKKNETYIDRFKLIGNVFHLSKKLVNIDLFNQLKTFININ